MPPKRKLRVGDRQRTGGLEFNPGQEPKFLSQFKARVGHREDRSKINDKFQKFDQQDKDNVESQLSQDALHNLEEMPQVVIPNSENILQSEIDSHFLTKLKEVEDDKTDLADAKKSRQNGESKIIFRKPTKKEDLPQSTLNASSSGSDNTTTTNKFKSKKRDISKLAEGLRKSEGDEEAASGNSSASKAPAKKVKKANVQLLSFGEAEDTDSD